MHSSESKPLRSGMSKGKRAVQLAASQSDYVVLAATFVGFFFLTSSFLVVSYLVDEEAVTATPIEFIGGLMGALVGGALLFVAILLFAMFMVRVMRQTALGNALQVEYSDYAWLRDWANVVAADLEMPRVEIFVTQDPVINAYAFGFVRPYCIVLHSGSIRYLSRNELKTIVVHEMAHIKYGHTIASVYLQPFVVFPVISILTSYLANFWRRRAELTSDRLALMYMGDAELVKKALIVVHVGPDVSGAMNQTARDWLQYNAERPMNRFAQTFSSHPFLVRRLSHIDRWKHMVEKPAPKPPKPVADTK